MSDQAGGTRIELMFRLEAALKRIEALENNDTVLKRHLSAAANHPHCQNCGDPVGEVFCGTCREMGCTALAPEQDK